MTSLKTSGKDSKVSPHVQRASTASVDSAAEPPFWRWKNLTQMNRD